MICAHAVQIRSLKNVVKNKIIGLFMKEEDVDQILTGLLVRISSLENLLIKNGIINKDEYSNELAVHVSEIQNALNDVKGKVNEFKEDKKDKLLS